MTGVFVTIISSFTLIILSAAVKFLCGIDLQQYYSNNKNKQLLAYKLILLKTLKTAQISQSYFRPINV